MSNEPLEQLANRDYEWGLTTDIEMDIVEPGLREGRGQCSTRRCLDLALVGDDVDGGHGTSLADRDAR